MAHSGKTSSSIPFPDEIAYLARIKEMAQAALQDAEDAVRQHRQEYRDFMVYVAQHRGEIDPREIFQSEQLLEQEGFSGLFALKSRDSLAKLVASPYFARLDFVDAHTHEASVYYIGRSTFRHQNSLYVLDWRAPAAGMFYDYELGEAGYDTPGGRVNGTLQRKRQFKISDGKMEYALESSLAIRDDVLQKELSQTSDEKMRSIISTLQKEQNLIIRDETARIMIIQGVAGSGKTSIALHRIAYLLYRFKDTLNANNVVILSPNRVFADHISGVLPELGEEPVYQMGFRQLADIQLEGVLGFYTERDPLETQDEAWVQRARLKGSAAFLQRMEEYIAHLSDTVFVPQEYIFGPFRVSKEWVWDRYTAYSRHPIKRRVREIADDICEHFKGRNIQQDTLPTKRAVLKALNGMLRLRTTRAAYKDMYRWLGMPRSLVVKNGSVEWEDVFPFIYLHAAFEGLRENHRIRHLVVDEMQDYTPVQFAVLKKLFLCNMTILGDFSQSVDPGKTHTLEDLCAIFPTARLMRLQKSYRSTCEILAFAAKIRPEIQLDAMQRHGPMPQVIACESEEMQLDKIVSMVQAFEKSGGVTLGILIKNGAQAAAMHRMLRQRGLAVQGIDTQSERFVAGCSVLSIGMSKGLEFDEVIVPFAGNKDYHTPHDAALLYVACTRAMHRLAVLYTGKKSPLLP